MHTPANPLPFTRGELLLYVAAGLLTLVLCDLAPWGWATPI